MRYLTFNKTTSKPLKINTIIKNSGIFQELSELFLIKFSSISGVKRAGTIGSKMAMATIAKTEITIADLYGVT